MTTKDREAYYRLTEQDTYVIRWVITKFGKNDPFRTLAEDGQGRCTYATREEAEARMNAFLTNNRPAIVEEYFPNAEVRECKCWPNHFDPKGVWFD